MHRKFPKQVIPDADEIDRVNRITIAEMYGIPPAAVDEMPEQDYQDTLDYLWAKEKK